MGQVCRCGRDSTAACVRCGTRLCDGCSDPSIFYVGSRFDVDTENTRATAKGFGPPPFMIASARENQAARDGWDGGDGHSIVCGGCRFSAAAVAVRSLREIPVPDEFGSLSEAVSDLIEGRWKPRAEHERPATPREIDDAIRWHTNNRAAEDVHDSWRSESTPGGWGSMPGSMDRDVTYRKGWTIGSTPDRSVGMPGYDGEPGYDKLAAVVVDQNRQFHVCDPSGRPPTGSGRFRLQNTCTWTPSGRWFDRREYSRWDPRPPTLLLGDLAGRAVGAHPGFSAKSTYYPHQGLLSVPGAQGSWYQPLRR